MPVTILLGCRVQKQISSMRSIVEAEERIVDADELRQFRARVDEVGAGGLCMG
jgi:hypothetical protein